MSVIKLSNKRPFDLNSKKDIDVYKLVSLIAGTHAEGILMTMLNDLRAQMSKREAALYSKTQNSSEIAQLDYQIDIQRKLIIEAIKNRITH